MHRVEWRSSSGSSVPQNQCVTISFVERYTRSEQFDQIFKEGMGLVEASASYLDGQGRQDARELTPAIAMLYATESMRLTTRLLELASWLLVRRSLKSGEITPDEARVKRRRIKLATVARPAHIRGYEQLPDGLRALVDKSYALNDRIVQLDRALESPVVAVARAPVTNPVGVQLAVVSQAFDKN